MSSLEEKKREFSYMIAQVKNQIQQMLSEGIDMNNNQQQPSLLIPTNANSQVNIIAKEKEVAERTKEFIFDREWTNKKASLLLNKKLFEQETIRLKNRQDEIKNKLIESNNTVISLKEEIRTQKERTNEVIREKESIIKEKSELQQTILLLQVEHELLDSQKNSIRESLQRSQTEVKSLLDQLHTKKESEVELMNKINELKNTITQMEGTQATMNFALIHHQSNIQNQSLELQTKSETIETLSSKLSRLDQRCFGLVKQVESQTKDMTAMQENMKTTHTALEASMKVSETAMNTQKEIMTSHEQAMKLKEQQIEDLRREVSTLQQQALLVQQGQKEGQIDTTSEPQSSNRISAESTSQSQPYYAPSVQYTPPNSMLAPRLVVPSTTKLPMDHQLNRQEEGVRTLFKPSDHEKSALTQSSEASDKICCICYQESSGLTVTCGDCQRECHISCVRKRSREDTAAGITQTVCKRRI